MDKKAARKKYKEEQLKLFRESLPIPETAFLPIFDYLDEAFGQYGCENNFRLLQIYCEGQHIDFERLSAWCCEQGAYCDCEVLANLEECFEYLREPLSIPVQKQQPAQKKKLNRLMTDKFTIDRIPAPWLLTEINDQGRISYRFTIGKKTDFYADLLFDFPVDKLSADEFLCLYWKKDTGINKATDLIIEREVMDNYQITQASTLTWAPVRIFVCHIETPAWCLVMKTELQRKRGDRKELEKLIRGIK